MDITSFPLSILLTILRHDRYWDSDDSDVCFVEFWRATQRSKRESCSALIIDRMLLLSLAILRLCGSSCPGSVTRGSECICPRWTLWPSFSSPPLHAQGRLPEQHTAKLFLPIFLGRTSTVFVSDLLADLLFCSGVLITNSWWHAWVWSCPWQKSSERDAWKFAEFLGAQETFEQAHHSEADTRDSALLIELRSCVSARAW